MICVGAVLSSCASAPRDASHGAPAPIMADVEKIEKAHTLAILVPGALTSIGIFDPAERWERAGYALAFYPFPGFDGRSLEEDVVIEEAASQISDFANRFPKKRIRLLGYSTGGPIVLSAAARIADRDVKVAVMSSAVSYGGGLETLLRGVSDITAAALRAGTLEKRGIWLEYYKLLLYGRSGLADPALVDIIQKEAEAVRDEMVVPNRRLTRSHTADLRTWRPQFLVPEMHEDIAFFTGMEDPVFATGQTLAFADRFGGPVVYGYPRQGHLLYLSAPRVFDDIFRFFEGKPVIR